MPAETVIYTRFSPRRNAEDSESCETQEALCREHATAQGWSVRGVHRDEAVSGKVLDRPGLGAALADLRRGDVLLVYRRDRIARDVLVSEVTRRRVQAAGARIVAVAGDVTGEDADPTVVFVRQILDAVAELERKQIAQRTSDGMRARQRAGQRMGRYAPYGWRLHAKDPSMLVKLPREQEAIERAVVLKGDGLSDYAVARALTEEGHPARGAKGWHQKTIARILRRAK